MINNRCHTLHHGGPATTNQSEKSYRPFRLCMVQSDLNASGKYENVFSCFHELNKKGREKVIEYTTLFEKSGEDKKDRPVSADT
jgi:hypothetical protein